MAEGTYEYECMRAELLGVAKPDYEEFLQRKQEESTANPEADTVESEEITNDPEDAAAHQNEQEQKSTTASGGSKLEELNNMISPVISITQKKIDNFKIRCGSVSDMIKTKIGSISGASGSTAEATDGAAEEQAKVKKEEETNIL